MLNNPSIKTVGDSATSLKVTDLLFGFTLCEKKQNKNKKTKKQTRKIVDLARLRLSIIKFSELFWPAIQQPHNRTAKCVFNIVFRFVYRSVQHVGQDFRVTPYIH